MRLQYSEDERLLLPALEELGGATAADFPVEALLQRRSLLVGGVSAPVACAYLLLEVACDLRCIRRSHLNTHVKTHTRQDNTLALMSSPKSSRAVQTAAAELLLRLITGLQRSIALSHDPELSASAYGTSESNTSSSNGAGAGSSSDGGRNGGGSSSAAQQGEMLQQLMASVRGSDPTCTDSYPSLPLPPAGLSDAWRMLPGQEREVVDVTSVVHSIVLQVLDLAKLPERHFELLPIIEAALPLLCAPLARLGGSASATAGEQAVAGTTAAAAAVAAEEPPLGPQALQRLSEALQAQWRGMLGALSRALASSLAVARSERATAAAGRDGGALAAEALAASGLVAWDLASINLLMLALRCVVAA